MYRREDATTQVVGRRRWVVVDGTIDSCLIGNNSVAKAEFNMPVLRYRLYGSRVRKRSRGRSRRRCGCVLLC